MRLFTGDECGLLKESIPELSRRKPTAGEIVPPKGAMPHVTKDGVSRIDPKELQTRNRAVVDMTFTNPDDDEENEVSFAALRLNGSVECWEGSAKNHTSFGNYDKVYTTGNIFQTKEGEKSARPLGFGAFEKQSRMCACDVLGNLAVIKSENGEIVQHYNAYTASKQGTTISYTPGNHVNTQLATAMACDPVYGRVAVGGRERETTMVDIESGKVVFKTKNLAPDPQTLLQQPVWPSSIIFMEDSNVMAVGSAYNEVRIYDVREDSKTRRPTATTPENLLEYRVTALCQVDPNHLAVGDSAGFIYDLDIRTLGRKLKGPANKDMARYVGPAGSVRQLKKHPTLPRLAAVGLDRMLRVYDTDKRKQLDCVYLKQRLNCALFCNDKTWGSEGDDDEDDDVDPDDLDIDQDDVVKDYIDSDEEQEEGDDDDAGGEMDSDEEQESSSSSQGDSEGEQGEEDSEEDPAIDEVEDDQAPSDEEIDEEEESDSDEEVIIEAPKKKRRR
jgi:ribosome biogenesis protein NSA1